MTDLELARAIAAKLHAGQKYGEDEYTVHLAEVEAAVVSMFPGEDRLPIIAQLHDILEDTACTQTLLRTLFDEDIVKAVVNLTYAPAEGRNAYLHRCKSNELSRKVKMADSYCNLTRSLMRGDMKRVKKYGETLAALASNEYTL